MVNCKIYTLYVIICNVLIKLVRCILKGWCSSLDDNNDSGNDHNYWFIGGCV